VFLLPAIIDVVIRITTLLPPSFSLLSATCAHSIVFFRGVLIVRIFSTLLSQVSIPLLVHNNPWNRPVFLPFLPPAIDLSPHTTPSNPVVPACFPAAVLSTSF
jgi:hypothetical protein